MNAANNINTAYNINNVIRVFMSASHERYKEKQALLNRNFIEQPQNSKGIKKTSNTNN